MDDEQQLPKPPVDDPPAVPASEDASAAPDPGDDLTVAQGTPDDGPAATAPPLGEAALSVAAEAPASPVADESVEPEAQPPWAGLTWKRVGVFLMSWAVPLFLIGGLAWEVLHTTVTDTVPVAMAPPEGYTAVKPDTILVWHQNGLEGEFQVELIYDDGDFDQPVFRRAVNGSQLTLPELEPGKTYRWRVTHVDSGMVSNELMFKTAPHLFRF